MSKALEDDGGVSEQQTRPWTCSFAQRSQSEQRPIAETAGKPNLADSSRSGGLQPLSPAGPSAVLATGASAESPSFSKARGLRSSWASGDVKSPSSERERRDRESSGDGDVQLANSPSLSSFQGDFPQAKDSSINASPSSSQDSKSFKDRILRDRVRNGDGQQARAPKSPAINASPSDQGEGSLRDSRRGGDVHLVTSPSLDASSPFQRARSLKESINIVDWQEAKSPSIPSSSRPSPAAVPTSIPRWASLGESVTSAGTHAGSAATGSPSRATPLSRSGTSLKSKLAAGHRLYGVFLVSFSTVVAEILGWAGYDFVVVDLETLFPGDNFAALPILQALASTGTPAILRLPGNDPVLVNKALDMGPAGLMFSMIEDEEGARNAVALCRYPPAGIRRGSRHVVNRASHYGLDASYMNRCEEELFVICQVETTEAIDHIIEIAGVHGVDCIQMGGLDFGASLGDPYLDYNKEKILSRQGKPLLAGFATPESSLDALFKRGYHLVSGAVDVVLLRDAAVADLRRNKPSF